MNKNSDEINKFNNLLDEKNLFVKQTLAYAKDLKTTISALKSANRELQEAYLDTVLRLVMASEYRDEDTGEHISRISLYCTFITGKMNFPDKIVKNIRFASPMHDVGKIGIPDSILLKRGKLTDGEFEIIKSHCVIGGRILSDSKAEILQLAESIALTHHEKWNGKGYPKGLSGDEIPIEGRIVALADVFDALTSKRPYKKSFSVERSCDIIKNEKGKHFDPKIVDVFFDNIDEIIKIKEEVTTEGHMK